MNASIETTVTTPSKARPNNKEVTTARKDLRRVRPIVDVFESDAEYRIHVEVPGVMNRDVQLTLERDALHLEAARHAHVAEPIIYDRTFALPDVVDSENVGAQLTAGVLIVTLPKRATAKPRQIRVNGG